MTPEEAISVIKTELGQFISDEKWKNALALAISALRAIDQYRWERDIAIGQLKELGYELGEKIRTDTDCVSRQAAIESVEKESQVDGAYGYMDTKSIIDLLEDLPSVQPETAKRIVGKSRDGMTLWYQCDMCNEPVNVQDNFCCGCGRRLTDG